MNGPASTVKVAIAGGASNVEAIVKTTSLPEPMVRMIVAELERVGELVVDSIGFGCPDGACGSCSSGSSCDHCSPDGDGNPVPVELGPRH